MRGHRMEVVATGELALSIVCMCAIFSSEKSTSATVESKPA